MSKVPARSHGDSEGQLLLSIGKEGSFNRDSQINRCVNRVDSALPNGRSQAVQGDTHPFLLVGFQPAEGEVNVLGFLKTLGLESGAKW